MESILDGPKSHDLQHHLIEDLVRHGNPAGYDCSPGESKMRVQKLKNTFSNKSAPSVDVSKKIMKTEIVRHILEGGVLNEEGTLFAHPNVLAEAKRTRAFRTILGTEEKHAVTGAVSLNDWEILGGRNVKKKSYPPQEHINLGIPNTKLVTCRKISTVSGPLFRDGGFYFKKDGVLLLCLLSQIYKSEDGYCMVVAEILMDVSRNFPDPFLQEMKLRTWKKSGRLLLLEQPYEVRVIVDS